MPNNIGNCLNSVYVDLQQALRGMIPPKPPWSLQRLRTNEDKYGVLFVLVSCKKKLVRVFLPKNGNVSATTKVERTKIVLRSIDTP